MKTDDPPICDDKSRPFSPELDLDPAWLLTAERQAHFSVIAQDGIVAVTLRLPNGSYVLCPRKGGGCLITQGLKNVVDAGARVRVLGISLEDARERVRRLNLPGRPDGFHLWN